MHCYLQRQPLQLAKWDIDISSVEGFISLVLAAGKLMVAAAGAGELAFRLQNMILVLCSNNIIQLVPLNPSVSSWKTANTVTRLEICAFPQCVFLSREQWLFEAHTPLVQSVLSFKKFSHVAEENSCSSTDAVWMNREQNVQTPVMMPSPHLTSTVLRDPKKMRPEDSFAAAYAMPTEQLPHQPVPPQQQQHHHHQDTIDYK